MREIIDEKEIQTLCSDMIDEIELRKGIGIYNFCEKLADYFFPGTPQEKTRWLQGCLSPQVLEYMRDHDIPNWVDD